MKIAASIFLIFYNLWVPLLATPSAVDLLRRATSDHIEHAQLNGKNAEAFTKLLLSSTDWQRDLLDSGSIISPTRSLHSLYTLWEHDPKLIDNALDRAMATACALEAPAAGWSKEILKQRYSYFKEKRESGRLNIIYKDLTTFQRRYLAKGVQHTGFNELSSMEYQNREVSLPSEKYLDACWYAPYLAFNPFGDSVQGPIYYQPFRESYSSHAAMVHSVGGVCGALSNFGAAAAIANGVPAATMGEPGHCAFAIMTAPNTWQPSYSLSWKRALHTYFRNPSWGWHLANNNAFADNDANYRAADLRRLAHFYSERSQYKNAYHALREARYTSPYDYQSWLASIAQLKTFSAQPTHWRVFHDDALKLLAVHSGEIAWKLLSTEIYPELLPKGQNKLKQRSEILLSFQKTLRGWGLSRWDYAECFNTQLDLLSDDPLVQDKFALRVFGLHAKANILTPVIFEEQLKRIGDDKKRRVTFIKKIARGLSQGNGEDYKSVIDSLAAQILPTAAPQNDRSTFQFIGQLTQKNTSAHPISPKKFPGILLSSGGTLMIDQPGNRWDNPARHWGVIEEHGGDFHTGSDKPFVRVQLGNFGKLSGVIIVTRAGNLHRLVGAILQASNNGQEWKDIHTFTTHQQVHRISLKDQEIDAGFVRVMHPNGHPLHFHKFLVYGKKNN